MSPKQPQKQTTDGFKVPSLPATTKALPAAPPLPYTPPSNAIRPTHDYIVEVIKDGALLESHKLNMAQTHFTFGRLPTCDFPMDHVSVSRYHAVLQFTTDEVVICDLGSSHGTFVNKQRVDKREPRRVEVGDQIRFGASSRVWVFGGGPQLPEPRETVANAKPSNSQKATPFNDPVKSLKAFLTEYDNTYDPEIISGAESLGDNLNTKYTVRIELPFNDEFGNPLIVTSTGSTRSLAERQACTSALEELASQGILNTHCTTLQSQTQVMEDSDEDCYDLTQSAAKSENVVETFESLVEKLKRVDEDMVQVQHKLDIAPDGDSRVAAEEVDELDAYMNALASGEQKKDRSALERRITELAGQKERLVSLLRIVAPDASMPMPKPKPNIAEVIEPAVS
ncbi:hypothetical protein LPJ66_002986, partial [Kickxella alabastrina]